MKVAFVGVKNWEREIIEKQIVDLDAFGVGLLKESAGEVIEKINNCEILSISRWCRVDEKLLDKLPKLKLIVTRSTGVDHIDLEACKRKKVEVKNVEEYAANSVAEYTFGLILALAKKLIPAHQSIEEGEYNPDGLTGVDLHGKTLGVIGVGNIGQKVVKLAKAFGMKVLMVERTWSPKNTNLEDLLSKSDFITLHVPYNEETKHLINKKNIKLVKKGTFLINTSRGPVVETAALVWALNNGVLGGVGLDTTEEETEIENVSVLSSNDLSNRELREILSFHLLRDRDDVVFTPHNAFNTKEALARRTKVVIEKINEFIKTECIIKV